MACDRIRWEQGREALDAAKRRLEQARTSGDQLDIDSAAMQVEMQAKWLRNLETELGGEPAPLAPVDMVSVASSNVVAAGWREDVRGGLSVGVLRVEFKGGGLYEYDNVTREWFDAFLQAKSKGRELAVIAADERAHPSTKLG